MSEHDLREQELGSQQAILLLLGRIDGRLDGLQKAFDKEIAEVKTNHGSLSDRVHAVEKRVWWASGAAVVIAAIVQYVFSTGFHV